MLSKKKLRKEWKRQSTFLGKRETTRRNKRLKNRGEEKDLGGFLG